MMLRLRGTFGPLVLSIGLITWTTGRAGAEMVFQVSGVVTSLSNPTRDLPAGVAVGANYAGTITFDETAPGFRGVGLEMTYIPLPITFNIAIGESFRFVKSSADPSFDDNLDFARIIKDRFDGRSFFDQYLLSSESGESSVNGPLVRERGESARLSLETLTSTPTNTLPSIELAGLVPRPELFLSTLLSFGSYDFTYNLADPAARVYNGPNFSISASVDRLTLLAAVPEPSSLASCGLAGAICACRAWRRRKRPKAAA